MEFGIDIGQQRMPFDEVVGRAQLGEELGFTGVWGFDHFQPMYGEGPGECFEAMTTLAALSGVTTTVRLGILVTGVTYRHPSVFAAEAITVDHASHGRLDIALGAAWHQPEHDQLGIPLPVDRERFDLLEDTCEILNRLFTGDTVSYAGKVVSLDGAQLRPVPVQTPRPPIWIGGSGPKRTVPLVARYADFWHTWPSENYPKLSARVDELAVEAGRDPADIRRAGSLSLSEDLSEVQASLERSIEAGFTYLICGWPGQGRERVAEFAETLLPQYR